MKKCKIKKFKTSDFLNHYFCEVHNSDFRSAEINPKICWKISHEQFLEKQKKFMDKYK